MVSGIQTIDIRNVNGTSAVTAVSEAATITFHDLVQGQTVSIAGVTFTAGVGGATAANVQAAFTTATITATTAAVTGGVLTDTATGTATNADTRAEVTALLLAGGYAAATGTAVVNSVVFTAAGTAANVVDLVVTGTGQTGIPQVTTLTPTAVAAATNDVVTFTYNGVTLTTAPLVTLTVAGLTPLIANAINAYAGSVVAVSSATAVTVTTPTIVNLAVTSVTSGHFTIGVVGTTAYAAAAPATVSIVQGVAASGGTSVTDFVPIGAFTGATSFVSDSSSGDVTFTGNLTAAQSVTLLGNGVTAGSLSATWGAAVATPVVNISGGTNGGNVTITSLGATTFTINSTGADNIIGALAAGGAITSTTSTLAVHAATGLEATSTATLAKHITIDGAATAVTLGTLTDATTAITIDASGLTAGGVTMTLLSNVASFKGGVGDDVITTAALTAVVAGEIDGGAGANTLVINAATDINSAVKAAEYTNFQTVKTGVTADLTYLTGPSNVKITATGVSVTGMSAVQAGAVSMSATDAGATMSLTSAGGLTDVLSLTLKASTTATPVNFTTATIDGFETLNVAVNGGISTAVTAAAATGADQISFTSAADLKSLVVTGGFDVGINVANAAKLTTLDVSGLTGATTGAGITLGANTGALVVTGSGAADYILLGTPSGSGTQTINSGLGNDTISGTEAQIAAATINGGGGTGDTLKFTDTATLTIADVDFQNVTGIEKVSFGQTTGDLIFTTSHYSDMLATANGGVLDVTAAALTTGAATINASGLSGTNSLKLSLTVTGGDGTADIGVTSSVSGTDSITIKTVTSDAGDVIVNAAGNTSSGVTIDASGMTFGSAANTFTGGTGADTILGGTVAATFTGGKGADTITLLAGHTGVQTIVFSGGTVANGASVSTQLTANGLDTINGFTSASDQMTVTALGDGSTTSSVTEITAAAAVGAMTTDNLYVVSATGAAANLMTSGTAVVSDWTNLTQVAAYLTERFTVTASAQHDVVVLNNTSGLNDTSYVYTLSNVGANTTIEAVDIALVGVVHHTAGEVLVDTSFGL